MQLTPIKPSMLTITIDILGFLHAYALDFRVALNFTVNISRYDYLESYLIIPRYVYSELLSLLDLTLKS